MTNREKMLATIQGPPSDQIPWALRMDLWYIALRVRGELPVEIEDWNTLRTRSSMNLTNFSILGP
jgi:hypothetical protein